MSDSLRVKDVVNSAKKDSGVAVKIKENNGNAKRAGRKTGLVFREMWANAFIRKKSGLEEIKQVSAKQKFPSPFIYLRMLAIMVFSLVVLLSLFFLFEAYELYPVIIVLGVVAVPLGTAIFFYEMDTSGRLSLYNILLIFFASTFAMLIIKFVSYRFIYRMNGEALSYFGAAAIGVMEAVLAFALCGVCVKSLKINDVISGVLIGAIIGAGFALVNGTVECFREVFIETQYTPTVEALIYNETLRDSFNNLLPVFLSQCLLHALSYLLVGASLGGVLVGVLNTGRYDRFSVLTLIGTTLGIAVADTLWVVPFTSVSDLFLYMLRAVITVAPFIFTVRVVRTGLSRNDYE